MVQQYTDEELRELIDHLISVPRENEWIEFKHNNADPARIGRYISALANVAALANRPAAYLVWGVEDGTQEVVGTTFNPSRTRVGGQDLTFSLTRSLKGEAGFEFAQTTYEGKPMVILIVDAARYRPVAFDGIQWVRIDSSLTELKNYPDMEGNLWDILRSESFETGVALDGVSSAEVLQLLDLETYYKRSRNPTPGTDEAILEHATVLGLARKRDDEKWQITNLGALLFAKDLGDFPSVKRKAVRVVQYEGVDRLESLRRQDGVHGYAVGFGGLLSWLKALLPAREKYVDGERVEEVVYSDLLLREIIGNALIHQSFLVTGAGPLVEVFSDRLEFTNPGTPLLDADRLINSPPISRNEALASLMRQMNLCEESGTGWDKIANETEVAGLPSPKIEVEELSTRVIIFGPRNLTTMDKADRVRAVYFHACLQYTRYQRLTNASLRARFGIPARSTAQVSRLLGDAISDGQIVLFDDSVGNKARSYVPYWAKQATAPIA
ncbi:ATP-binding protein [Curtobacterium sp. Leaf261]|uniref:ATP-binding protein n=1 Tax=Curtobacterium sp. Leaf261 TaxID=1736311 RepID=UPI0006F6DFF5|nr:ATP-binding protein [Curtobacterium sp. Leaf261]KQO59962.1 hypothetical protein ASF23_15015 [Curtobacterium sp. Leaf261]